VKKRLQNQQELICQDQVQDAINVSPPSVIKHVIVYKVLNVLGVGYPLAS
jgi:hypothetical protein